MNIDGAKISDSVSEADKKGVRYIVLSKDAASILKGVSEISDDQICHAPLERLSEVLPTLGDCIAVVAEVGQIDDRLVGKIAELQSLRFCQVGILPYDPKCAQRLLDMLAPAVGNPRGSIRSAVYSVDSGHMGGLEFLTRSLPGITLLDANEEHFRLLQGNEFDVFAGVTNGRQTFCFFGRHYSFHPGLKGDAPFAIQAHEFSAKHWFLQSCHSPFTWEDFGNYLSFPLAVILRGKAISFISSVRVQPFIPNVLASYLQLVLDGATLGETVWRLNSYSFLTGCDYAPFVLFGHPLSRVVTCKEQFSPPHVVDFGRETNSDLLALQTRLSNLHFAVYPPHFGLNLPKWGDKGRAQQVKHRFQRLKATIESTANTFANQVRTWRIRSYPSIFGVDGTAPRNQPLWPGTTTVSALEELANLWAGQRGYYYDLSDYIESNYTPTSSCASENRCPACLSALSRRTLDYCGPFPTASYKSRIQMICPRCLVVTDANPEDVENITLIGQKPSESRFQLSVKFKNHFIRSRYVTMRARLIDPNNVSSSISPTLVRRLLESVLVNGAPYSQEVLRVGGELPPGESLTLDFFVDVRESDLFYLLAEIDLFVEGAWSWASFTIRRPTIEKWLTSEDYPKTLPSPENK